MDIIVAELPAIGSGYCNGSNGGGSSGAKTRARARMGREGSVLVMLIIVLENCYSSNESDEWHNGCRKGGATENDEKTCTNDGSGSNRDQHMNTPGSLMSLLTGGTLPRKSRTRVAEPEHTNSSVRTVEISRWCLG